MDESLLRVSGSVLPEPHGAHVDDQREKAKERFMKVIPNEYVAIPEAAFWLMETAPEGYMWIRRKLFLGVEIAHSFHVLVLLGKISIVFIFVLLPVLVVVGSLVVLVLTRLFVVFVAVEPVPAANF